MRKETSDTLFATRDKIGSWHVLHSDNEEHHRVTQDKREQALPPAPAMGIAQEASVVEQTALLSNMVNHVSGETVLPVEKHNPALQTEHTHQDNAALAGFVSDEWLALVHTPVNIPDTMCMPAAKAAMDQEWNKLWGKCIWKVDSVREHRRR